MTFILAIAFSLLFDKEIERTFALSIMSISILIYVGSSVLKIDVIFVALYCFVCSAICIGIIVSKIKDNKLTKYIGIATSFIVFIISFFAFYSMGRGVYRSADLNTWAYLVKAMYISGDAFIRGGDGSYPRATMLWNLFVNKTWIGYSESISLWAQNVFTVSLLMPLYRFVNGEKKAEKGIILGAVILLLPLALTNSTYSSLFPDTLLGLLFVYCIIACFNYFNEKDNFCIAELVLGLYSLTLTKRIGVVLAAVVILIFAYLAMDTSDNRKNNIIKTCVLSIITSAYYISWNGVGKNALLPICALIGGITLYYIVKFSSKPSVNVKKAFIFMLPFLIMVCFFTLDRTLFRSEYVRLLTNNYLKQFMTVWESSIGFVVQMSLGTFMLVIAGLIYTYIKRTESIDGSIELAKRVVVLTYLGNFIYLFLLWVEYVTVIGTPENNGSFGIYATSFERYTIPCYISLLVLAIYLFLVNQKEIKVKTFAALLAIILLTVNANDLVDYMFIKYEQPQYYGFEQAGITLTENDIVYFIDENKGDDTTDSYAFMYAMYPATCDVRNELDESTLKANGYDYVSAYDLEKKLLDDNYTYVYIQSIDDQFVNMYGELFEDKTQIATGYVYSVENIKGKVVLSRK